jgi:hypothetical protein
MTIFTQLFSRNLKIAMIVAFACVCVRPAMGEQDQIPATPVPPNAQPMIPQPATEPQNPAEKQELSMFFLKYGDPELIIKVLSTTIKGGRFAIDKRTNAIIVSASSEQMKAAEAILKQLDTPGPVEQNRSLPVNVRVFWLADGLKDASAPAESLKEVVEELHHQGLKNIGQVAQTMVRTRYEGQFHMTSSPLLDGTPTMFIADGRISNRSIIDIRISANYWAKPGVEPGKLAAVDVNTVFTTGEYIVLAVAPTDKVTSVFVIQITEGKQ